MSLLSKVYETITAQSELVLDQQADDGSNRVLIKDSGGSDVAEIYHDGTNTVVNPLTGAVDANGNDITGVGALDTGEIGNGGSPITQSDILNFSGISDGDVGAVLREGEFADGEKGGRVHTALKNSVGTQTENILDITTDTLTGDGGAWVIVTGVKQGGTDRFTDVMQYVIDTVNVLSASVSSGSPDGRTYDTYDDKIRLSMAANTYNVVTTAMVHTVQN